MILMVHCLCSHGQCLSLSGTLVDVTTQKTISEATFYGVTGKQRKQLTKAVNGVFELNVPCNTEFLSIESSSYRPTLLRLNNENFISGDKTAWFLTLQLVGIDLQANDKPYFQQEQKHFELKNTQNNAEKKPFASRIFKVIDALNQESLKASLCLIYTKTGQKNCFDLANNQNKEILFEDQDIVALEVKSPNYQTYNGNLILDQLDNQQKPYEIKLAKELTILSVDIPNNDDVQFSCSLKPSFGKEVLMKKIIGNKYFAYLSPDTYQFKVLSSKRETVLEKSIIVKTGLNIVAVKLKPINEMPQNKPVKISEPIKPIEENAETQQVKPIILGNKVTLFFDQGDYRLRPESESYLKELTQILKQKSTALLRIVGFTDDVGIAKKNVVLSEFRSIVIRNYLIQHGIEEERLINMGVGSRQSVAPNDTDDNKAKNRRAELQIIE
jgi:outer membrane protein OmpA-like peptidoglycan-associated protein